MDADKRLKLSRYLFSAGVLAQFLSFALMPRPLAGASLLLVGSYALLITAVFVNFKAKGLTPFRSGRFYVTGLALLWPFIGALYAASIMCVTGRPDAHVPRWRQVLLSPWAVTLAFCLLLGLVAAPQYAAFRIRATKVHMTLAQRHLAAAADAATADELRKELDNAASQLANARRIAVTDRNSGWLVRTIAGGNIIRDADLDGLEADIARLRSAGPSPK